MAQAKAKPRKKKKEPVIAYKVVYNHTAFGFVSACRSDYMPDCLRLRYSKEEWTTGVRDSKVFVFITYEDALKFVRDHGWFYSHKIFKVECRGKITRQVPMAPAKLRLWLADGPWAVFIKKLMDYDKLKELPAYACRSVRLLEEVPYERFTD